jgi:GABA(A) receptor-associated protein
MVYYPDFKKEYNFDERFKESLRVVTKYPDRVPIICDRSIKSLPEIDKKKYLVPIDLTVGQFSYVIRKRLALKPEEALFIFIDNKTIPAMTANMGTVYNEYKDQDGFLYLTYAKENVFG